MPVIFCRISNRLAFLFRSLLKARKFLLKPFLKCSKLRREVIATLKRKKNMTISCLQGGQAIIQLSGGTKTNLEIQKILYFAGMLYIGENEGKEPLIENKFLTWRFGPAFRKLHDHVKEYGNNPIPAEAFSEIIPIMDDENNAKEGYGKEVSTINEAYERWGGFSAYKLVQISHWSKGAWRSSLDRGKREIDNELILEEYKARYDQ